MKRGRLPRARLRAVGMELAAWPVGRRAKEELLQQLPSLSFAACPLAGWQSFRQERALPFSAAVFSDA